MNLKKNIFSLSVLVCFIFSTIGMSIAHDALTQEDVDNLMLIRQKMFGGSKINEARTGVTISGESPPIFAYDAADRTIISWKINGDMVADFAAAIGLPRRMSLAKVAPFTENILRTYPNYSRKSYYIMAEIANTERYVQGTKVEWKTFVTVGDDPTPRMFRFDSQDANRCVDLLELAAEPFGQVEWSVKNGLASGLITNGEHTLDISIPFNVDETDQFTTGDTTYLIRKYYRFTKEFLTASEHVYSALGFHSRYYYNGTSTSTKFYYIDKTNASIINTFPWAAFVGDVDSITIPVQKTKYLVQPIGIPIIDKSANDEELPYEMLLFDELVNSILKEGKKQWMVLQRLMTDPDVSRFKLPTLYYAILDVYQALKIRAGTEPPKMVFSLTKEPMAIWINFEIPEENIEAFKEEYLPENFKLAKIKFFPEQESGVYALSLNVYEATGGQIGGKRAEWSTYIINPKEENPKPRFSVIEAQTSSLGFDPVVALERYNTLNPDLSKPGQIALLLEPPADTFEFTLDHNGLFIQIEDIEEDIFVDVSIAYPDEEDILYTSPVLRWMEANDLVYWGEAADAVKYDGKVIYADLMVFNSGPEDIISDTAFSQYVDPEPLHIIFWDGVQDFAVEPWANIQDILQDN